MPDKAQYEKLYEIAARKVDKMRSNRRKEYKADRAAGRNPKLNEDNTTVQSEYRKLASDYEKKNRIRSVPGESPRYEVLKEKTAREASAKKKIAGRKAGKKN
jgi:hypothetical protein